MGKNKDKPLRFKLNQQRPGNNQNKSQGGLSEPEKIYTGKNMDKPLINLN